MLSKHITALPTGKDSHSLVHEANAMLDGLAALASAQDGTVEQFTGESLFFLLKAINEKLQLAEKLMETGD